MSRKDKACIVDGCQRRQHAHEMCRLHYSRHWRGKPLEGPECNRKTPSPAGEAQLPERQRNAEGELERAQSSYDLASSIGSRMFWASEIRRIRQEVEELKAKGAKHEQGE